MILGLNESAYSIPRDRVLRSQLFSEWRGFGILGWRPNATLFIPPSPGASPICTQSEFESHLKVCVSHWLSSPGTEVVLCLTNANYGVENTVRPEVWQEFLAAENGDDRKARTSLISCALRVKYAPLMDWLASEWRRWVRTLFAGFGARLVWEVGNADLDYWNTDWASHLNLNTKGKSLCALLNANTPGDPRKALLDLWKRTFSLWERWTKSWITDTAFCYSTDTETKITRSQPNSGNYLEVGGTKGHLEYSFALAETYGGYRLYAYAWSWAGYAWQGWQQNQTALYQNSDLDPEGYANLVNRKDELKAAIGLLV